MKHVLVDLETLGTDATSIIISIGAVKFDLEKGVIDNDAFYASISVESNLRYKRDLTESTLVWWMEQSKEAQAVFTEPKMTLDGALQEFADWIGARPKYLMWGNGPTFDLGMLANAYRDLGWETPWEFWNERCVRTYRDLPGAKNVPKVVPQIAHNALHDAHAEAQHLINIHQVLFKGVAVKDLVTA